MCGHSQLHCRQPPSAGGVRGCVAIANSTADQTPRLQTGAVENTTAFITRAGTGVYYCERQEEENYLWDIGTARKYTKCSLIRYCNQGWELQSEFVCLFKAYSPANRTGSPQGFYNQRLGHRTFICTQRELACQISNSRHRSGLWKGICKQMEVQVRYLTVDTDQGFGQVSVNKRELAGTGQISNSRQRARLRTRILWKQRELASTGQLSNSRQRSGLWTGIYKQRDLAGTGQISNRRHRSGLRTGIGICKQRDLGGQISNSRQRAGLTIGICKQRQLTGKN